MVSLQFYYGSMKILASDTCAPAHPVVLEALAKANGGHQPSYGEDPYTIEAQDLMDRLLGASKRGLEARLFTAYNGTGANTLAIMAGCERFDAVLCSGVSHINTDETAAPEGSAHVKLLSTPDRQGKIDLDTLGTLADSFTGRHRARPRLLSLTQSTEMGTVYSQAEYSTLIHWAQERSLGIHVDGARLAQAAVTWALNDHPQLIGSDLELSSANERSMDRGCRAAMAQLGQLPPGSFIVVGAGKNGAMAGEALVYLHQPGNLESERIVEKMTYLQKTALQLHAKNRYLASQFTALYDGEIWWRNGLNAHLRARQLAQGLQALGYELPYPTEANGVFPVFPQKLTETLQKEYYFYSWDESRGLVRLMTSWDTSTQFIEEFLARVGELS